MVCERVGETWKPQSKTRELLADAQAVMEDFWPEFILTVRQVYYNLVDKWLPRTEPTAKQTAKQVFYEKLQIALRNARMSGLVDWKYIEDRSRGVVEWQHWASPQEVIQSGADSYAREMWETQPLAVEVHVEKDTLAGVVRDICMELDVSYLSHRGECSISDLYEAGRRMRNRGKPTIVIYVGDHDPTGLDIPRTAAEMWDDMRGVDCEIIRAAVTLDQGEDLGEVKAVPNSPGDTKSAAYEARYGIDYGWEAEALDPREIVQLVREEVEDLRDDDLWEKAVRKQERERKTLGTIARHYPEIKAMKWKRKPR